MIPYKRQEKILETLNNEDFLKIEDIHTLIPSVSISTLRRDLKELESKGKIVMLTGGAVKIASPISELSVKTKQSLYSQEKEIIAELAEKMINDGEVIYVDSGTTCTALLKKIVNKRISIVTSNASAISITTDIQADIIILGGHLNPITSSLNGPLTENNLQNFYFDKAFLGANGIDPDRGVSTPHLVEANKKMTVIKNSRQVYLLTDSSKFHVNAAVKAFDLCDVTVISEKNDQKIAEVTRVIYKDQKS